MESKQLNFNQAFDHAKRLRAVEERERSSNSRPDIKATLRKNVGILQDVTSIRYVSAILRK